MPLTDHERTFLAAFIHEATTDPFNGPGTAELHRRDIYYTDLSHLLTAYYRENAGGQEGFGGSKIRRRRHVPRRTGTPPFAATTNSKRNWEVRRVKPSPDLRRCPSKIT